MDDNHASSEYPPSSLEDMRLWIVAHDTKIDIAWHNQGCQNKRVSKRIDGQDKVIDGIRTRINWAIGAVAGASFAGSFLGGAILSKIASG